MPIFSYFAVVGTVLLGLLLWVSNEIEPGPPPIVTSQMVGLPKSFKALPDSRNRERALTRADDPEPPAANMVKQVSATPKKKAARKGSKPPEQNRVAEYPSDRLSIH